MSTSIPMQSAKIANGRYEVVGTSTGCEVVREGKGDWVVWVLYSDGVRLRWFLTKREALVYCQERPEL